MKINLDDPHDFYKKSIIFEEGNSKLSIYDMIASPAGMVNAISRMIEGRAENPDDTEELEMLYGRLPDPIVFQAYEHRYFYLKADSSKVAVNSVMIMKTWAALIPCETGVLNAQEALLLVAYTLVADRMNANRDDAHILKRINAFSDCDFLYQIQRPEKVSEFVSSNFDKDEFRAFCKAYASFI